MIDAAIEAGKIQKIPKGQSGILPDPVPYRESHNGMYSQYILGRKKAGEVTRGRIKYLMSQGLSIVEIGETMSLKPQHVKYHLSKIKETE